MGTDGAAGAGRGRARSAPAQGAAARRAVGAGVAALAPSTGPSRSAQARYRADAFRSPRRGAPRRRARRPTRRGHGASGGVGDWVARSLGLGVAVVTVSGRDAHERAQDPRDRRHRCQPIAAVFRRGRSAGAARGRSADQTGERAQALPQPGRHRDRRAHALRRLAEGRRRAARSRPTARRSTRSPTAVTPIFPSSSARARTGGCANSSPCSTRWTN